MSEHSEESKDFLKKVEKMTKYAWKRAEQKAQEYKISLYLWVLDYEDAYIYRYDVSEVKFDFTRIDCFDKYIEDQGHNLQDCEFMLTDQSTFHIG